MRTGSGSKERIDLGLVQNFFEELKHLVEIK
jgi:hypothetical protein